MALAVRTLNWLESGWRRFLARLALQVDVKRWKALVLYLVLAVVAFLTVSSLLQEGAAVEPDIQEIPLEGIQEEDIEYAERFVKPSEILFSNAVSMTDGAWQNVTETSDRFLVFAAYYEERAGHRQIRIISAAPTRRAPPVGCRFLYGEQGEHPEQQVVPARVQAIRENWNLRYSASFVLCPLQPDQPVPLAVSVVTAPLGPGLSPGAPGNLLRVQLTDGHPPPSSLAVCVAPIQLSFNRAVEFVEFLELYTILGAQQFTFYNSSIGPQVSCILEDYVKRGIATLLPWELDMASETEIRYYGIFAALNDCLYRQMSRHALLALVDVDEYLVPKNHEGTLPEFIESLGKEMNISRVGAFSFQNAFFYRQFPDDELVQRDGVARHLLTARKTLRRAKLNPHGQRSKYMCRAQHTVEVGNHFVWELMPGYRTADLSPSQAASHHYRVCEFGGDDCVKEPHVLDRTAHRYRDQLAERVARVWARLGQSCGLPDLQGNASPAAF